MRLVLLGPPGCGKGTQASLLCQRHAMEHIATGDLLREAIRLNTATGARARRFVEAGQLVPDEVVNALVADRFGSAERPQRFVMDGYPRTLSQARSFEAVLAENHLPLDGVLLLKVSDEEIIRRLAGRRVCPNTECKASYHEVMQPPRTPGVCDRCGTPLILRSDDDAATVRSRLEVYHRETAELIPFFRGQGLLREVSGEGSVEQVYQEITHVLPQERK